MSIPLDPFGRSSIPASVLELRASVVADQHTQELRHAALYLAASDDAICAAVGGRLLRWFEIGGRIDKALGVCGPRGRHRPSSR